MSAPKGNQYAKGNKGGRPSKYKPEFAETAQKLCAKCGFTDMQLAEWLQVNIDTIDQWKLKHPEFGEAVKVGKAETDDLVERSVVAHIAGYYVKVDEMDRFGNVKQLHKWIPGNPHVGMKWLAARRPEQYKERKEGKHILSMDDAFLKFLEEIEEEARESVQCTQTDDRAEWTGSMSFPTRLTRAHMQSMTRSLERLPSDCVIRCQDSGSCGYPKHYGQQIFQQVTYG
jgi:hypothetical protein